MSEENELEEEESPPATVSLADSDRPKELVDWNPDYFPTSAKTVFIWAGILVLGLSLLSFLAWYGSESKEERTSIKSKISSSKPIKLEMTSEELDE